MTSLLERWWYPPAGEREPLGRAIALSPLVVPELGFRAGVATRAALYRAGLFRPRVVRGAKVISVGNLTVGGAGKTPVVIHLASRLARAGRKVAVVSRGYGRASREVFAFDQATTRTADETGDEPLLIARRCPGVTVWVGPDKAELARRAHEEGGAEVILIDDGFQTRRLARDLELVVIDTGVGLGNGHLLPRGTLREPRASLGRADLLWLKGDRPFESGGLPFVRARHRPALLVRPDGVPEALSSEAARSLRFVAFCGIARPGPFFAALRNLGLTVVDERAFPDHHRFSPASLEALQSQARSRGAELLTTEKDGVRLPTSARTWTVRLDVEVTEGGDRLASLLGV
jgi:tetraacyldisaccharide 4'-kinase